MKGPAYAVVDGLADACAAVLRLIVPAAPLLRRFATLCRLRALARGVVPVETQFDGTVRCSRGCRLHLGRHCRIGHDVYLETNGDGRIEFGESVRVNLGCVIVADVGITIGDESLLGEYVSIRDANHGIAPGEPVRTQPQVAAPIWIGRDVWIGRAAVILKGVAIGDGAVVAANSVVLRDVPANAVVGGSPARVLRMRDGSDPPVPAS